MDVSRGFRVCLVFAAVTLGPSSCGDEETASCPINKESGLCVGVTRPEICQDAFCTAGPACKNLYHVQQGASPGGSGSLAAPFAELDAAAQQASTGDCIAVAAGSYAAATLKGGVSLLGRGAGKVTIKGTGATTSALTVQGGAGGVLRGFAVTGTSRGLSVSKVSGLKIEQVKVNAATEVALEARGSTAMTIEQVELSGTRLGASGGHGIGLMLAEGSSGALKGVKIADNTTQGVLINQSGVKIDGSLIKGNKHYGVSIDCKGSGCKGALAAEIKSTLLDGNGAVGLLLAGGKLTASSLEVARTQAGSAGVARGLEAHSAAAVQLTGINVHHTQGLGLILIGVTGAVKSGRVADNEDRGVWVQSVTAGALALQQIDVTGNRFAGIGSWASPGLSIDGGKISGTKLKILIDGPTTISSGDGIQALSSSGIKVKNVQVVGNARVGVLFDASSGSVTGSTITGGKAALVVQNGAVDPKAFSNNVGSGSQPVSPQTPTTPFMVPSKGEQVSSLPFPLP